MYQGFILAAAAGDTTEALEHTKEQDSLQHNGMHCLLPCCNASAASVCCEVMQECGSTHCSVELLLECLHLLHSGKTAGHQFHKPEQHYNKLGQ
jgi:hypothetical protein